MNRNLKDLLLECEMLLEKEDFDTLIKVLGEINSEEINNLSKEEYEEALKIIEFLIEKAEKKKLGIAEKLMNFQRFRGYLK